MKRITIKSIRLVNFKGAADAEYRFDSRTTSICGRNGLGKSTIFDAFTWVLFGKDSHDNKKFNIKTIDASGKIIPRLPHEVTAVLDVNGEEITVRRTYTENWVRRRGSADEEFTGHTEKRYWNDVEISAREYDSRISGMCSEQTFKFITNPMYFSAQKPDVQRAMLFSLAGELSMEEVAGDDDDFKNLLDSLTGKTLEEYRKEIAAKKRVIRQDIESLPARIDERKMNAPQAEDWDALEKTIGELKQNLSVVTDRMNAEQNARNEVAENVAKLNSQFYDVKMKIQEREGQIRTEKLAGWNDIKAKHVEAMNAVRMEELALDAANRKVSNIETSLAALEKDRANLLDEYRKINSSSLNFIDDEFVCPTCGRKYDIDDIIARQDKMTAKFNQDKARKLADNKEKGLAKRQAIDALKSSLEQAKTKVEESKVRLAGLNKKVKEYADKITDAPDTSADIDADAEIKKLRQMQDGIVESIRIEKEKQCSTVGSEYESQRDEIVSAIEEANRKLASRTVIERNDERIAELTRQFKSQSEALALLEGEEYTIARFSKARVLAIEDKVNAMFDTVKFKLFDTQINGGEVETCEATVNGVPYSDLNSAARINAGIEIINAICRKEEIYAPCFVDNAETVNNIHPTDEQLVRLVVTDDEKLTIR